MIEESSALKYEDGCNFVTHDTCSFVMVQRLLFLYELFDVYQHVSIHPLIWKVCLHPYLSTLYYVIHNLALY